MTRGHPFQPSFTREQLARMAEPGAIRTELAGTTVVVHMGRDRKPLVFQPSAETEKNSVDVARRLGEALLQAARLLDNPKERALLATEPDTSWMSTY
ncbi:hypothetical protein [Salinactinospora qingdaonensis]|uniref:YbaB/EbfC DNA-binding family protein n=1 Tax=Salinactinospora qingdaonensis TaxID=702744 RepID=A0ABP7F1J3_9ACTN